MSNHIIEYYENGNKKIEKWCREDYGSSRHSLPHRLDGPAIIHYYPNGNRKSEKWGQNNKFYREDGSGGETLPVHIEYFYNGNKEYEKWYQNGKCHKDNAPAEIKYYENGNKEYEKWFQHGKLYRLDGPASIEYDENGNIELKKYFINGKRYTENEFYRTIYLIKKFINKLKEKQRIKYSKLLQTTSLKYQGNDITNILVKFVC